jgi:hypothetical protein
MLHTMCGFEYRGHAYSLRILNLTAVHIGLLKLMFNGTRGSGIHRNFFFGGWGQQIQLRTEGRENGDLGVVAP